MSKYEAVYFVGDNQAINRVRVDSSNTRNRGAFSGSLAALTYRMFYTQLILCTQTGFRSLCTSRPVFTKGLSQGLGLKLRLLSQASAQKLLRLLSLA